MGQLARQSCAAAGLRQLCLRVVERVVGDPTAGHQRHRRADEQQHRHVLSPARFNATGRDNLGGGGVSHANGTITR